MFLKFTIIDATFLIPIQSIIEIQTSGVDNNFEVTIYASSGESYTIEAPESHELLGTLYSKNLIL